MFLQRLLFGLFLSLGFGQVSVKEFDWYKPETHRCCYFMKIKFQISTGLFFFFLFLFWWWRPEPEITDHLHVRHEITGRNLSSNTFLLPLTAERNMFTSLYKFSYLESRCTIKTVHKELLKNFIEQWKLTLCLSGKPSHKKIKAMLGHNEYITPTSTLETTTKCSVYFLPVFQWLLSYSWDMDHHTVL